MKRDIELIRAVLLFVESNQIGEPLTITNGTEFVDEQGLDGIDIYEILNHFQLLIDDGYLNGKCIKHGMGFVNIVCVDSITMKGHDYIDAIRDKGIWTEVKKELGVVGDFWTLDTIAKLAAKVASKKLGIS